jgi:GNAT superfamily N-acetyltransferase
MEIQVRPLGSAREAWTLRRDVLRPGLPLSSIDFPEDAMPDAAHFGAFSPTGLLIGVASLYRQKLIAVPGVDPALWEHAAWRLRGMAVDPAWQKTGIGSRLLVACFEHVEAHGSEALWCHGRTSAREFYRRHGFTALGQELVLPNSGPHYVMVRG